MKYAKFSDTFLSYFRLDDNGETLVLTDKRGYTRAVRLLPYEERPQGEYETACNVLLSLEQIVRSSDGWEDSAVEAVHNAVQTAIKCMHERPQGEWIKITREGTVPAEYVCSCCGRKIYDNYELSIPMSEFYPYCHCGADMRGGAE